MGVWDYLLCGLLLLWLAAVIWHMRKRKKSGASGCGCAGCSGCDACGGKDTGRSGGKDAAGR